MLFHMYFPCWNNFLSEMKYYTLYLLALVKVFFFFRLTWKLTIDSYTKLVKVCTTDEGTHNYFIHVYYILVFYVPFNFIIMLGNLKLKSNSTISFPPRKWSKKYCTLLSFFFLFYFCIVYVCPSLYFIPMK